MLVDHLAYHEKKLDYVGNRPFGLRTANWNVDAVLRDAEGRLVLLVEISSGRPDEITALMQILAWGFEQLPTFPDVRLMVVLRDKADASPLPWMMKGADRVRFYQLEVALKPTAPKATNTSGG